MGLYGEREDAVRPALQISMPRLPRLYAPGVPASSPQGAFLDPPFCGIIIVG